MITNISGKGLADFKIRFFWLSKLLCAFTRLLNLILFKRVNLLYELKDSAISSVFIKKLVGFGIE